MDNAVVTEQALLRMTVQISGPVPATSVVSTLTAQTSASRNPGDPNEVTKTLTVNWDASSLSQGTYAYSVSGAIIQFHQNHRGQNNEPRYNVKATTGTLCGAILLDCVAPVISDLTPPDGSFTSDVQPEISATYSDTGSGINVSSLQVRLDSAPVTVTATASGFGFVPELLGPGVHTVSVSVADNANNTSSASWSFSAGDSVPPVVTAPPNVVAEATGPDGAVVNYPPATATDNITAHPEISYSQDSGTVFPLGSTMVTVTATDAAGNVATTGFAVTVQDTTGPTLYPPADMLVEATSCDGAVVYYMGMGAWDAVSGWLDPTYGWSSGSLFPVGATVVTMTATDNNMPANTSSTTFTVTVRDTTPPYLMAPAPVTVTTHNAAGAQVWFDPLSAWDAVTEFPTIVFDPPSGSVFPVGVTSVNVIATDAAGNSAPAQFTVTVAFVNTPPSAYAIYYTLEAGTVLNADGVTTYSCGGWDDDYDALTFARLTDPLHGTLEFHADGTFVYTPEAGCVGPDSFTYAANDSFVDSAPATVSITVQDTTPPVITGTRDIVAEATGPDGALVVFSGITITDNVTANPSVLWSQPSGSTFSIGTTYVWLYATDASGNLRVGSFYVTVQDTTPPTIVAPDIHVEATPTSPNATFVEYPPATVTDLTTPAPFVTYSHPSGMYFPFGTTVVHVTATDWYGNSSTANFKVFVEDTIPPLFTSIPASVVIEATRPDGAPVNYPPATATDNLTANPAILYSQDSGTVFPFGITTVSVTASDASGNVATAAFTVTVQDTTAPIVSNLTPAAGNWTSNAQPVISAQIADAATGVEWSSLSVTLDGVEITAVFTPTGFSYLPPADLTAGLHVVQASVFDNQGNHAEMGWWFTCGADNQPPTFVAFVPADGSTVDERFPLICAGYTDDVAGVNPASLQVELDQTPIGVSYVCGTYFLFTPDLALADGQHSVTVTVADFTGKSATATWYFAVDTMTPRVHIVPSEGPLPVTWTAFVRVNDTDDVTDEYLLTWTGGPDPAPATGTAYTIPLGAPAGDYAINVTATYVGDDPLSATMTASITVAPDGNGGVVGYDVGPDMPRPRPGPIWLGDQPLVVDGTPKEVRFGSGTKLSGKDDEGNEIIGMQVPQTNVLKQGTEEVTSGLSNSLWREKVEIPEGEKIGYFEGKAIMSATNDKWQAVFPEKGKAYLDKHATSLSLVKQACGYVSEGHPAGYVARQVIAFEKQATSEEVPYPNSGYTITYEISWVDENTRKYTIRKKPEQNRVGTIGSDAGPSGESYVEWTITKGADGTWTPQP